MILRHPIARMVVDAETYSSAQAAVQWAEVRLSLGGAHDAARVGLWLNSRAGGVAPEARASIALGEGTDLTDVWAGTISWVEAGERRVALEGLSHTAQLSAQRVARAWQDQSVGDIVRDLAGPVQIDNVDASLQLPWYAVDTRRTVWSHLRELAQLIGADVTSNPSGGVRFVPSASSAQTHTLRYGADLIRWQLAELPAVDAPGIRAYGAASEAGAQQWHWLLGDAGSGGGVSIPGAIRTKDAADLGTKARTDRAARRAHRASVLALGVPAIRPGDVVRLADVPGAPQERYRVTGVAHRLDGRTGFTSALQMEGAPE